MPTRTFYTFAFVTSLLFSFTAHAQLEICRILFAHLNKFRTEKEHGISVSGRNAQNYLRRLKITADKLAQLHGQRVLDVCGGYSDFVDVLNEKHGIEAIAVDRAYSEISFDRLPETIRERVRQRRRPMDVRNLNFPDGHFKLVVSNTLLNWYFFGSGTPSKERIDEGFKILSEMIRVTEPGGEIRVTHFPNPTVVFAKRGINEVTRYYKEAFDKIKASLTSTAKFEEFPPETNDYLTRIKKLNAAHD